jgi:hypothetical protein
MPSTLIVMESPSPVRSPWGDWSTPLAWGIWDHWRTWTVDCEPQGFSRGTMPPPWVATCDGPCDTVSLGENEVLP